MEEKKMEEFVIDVMTIYKDAVGYRVAYNYDIIYEDGTNRGKQRRTTRYIVKKGDKQALNGVLNFLNKQLEKEKHDESMAYMDVIDKISIYHKTRGYIMAYRFSTLYEDGRCEEDKLRTSPYVISEEDINAVEGIKAFVIRYIEAEHGKIEE